VRTEVAVEEKGLLRADPSERKTGLVRGRRLCVLVAGRHGVPWRMNVAWHDMATKRTPWST